MYQLEFLYHLYAIGKVLFHSKFPVFFHLTYYLTFEYLQHLLYHLEKTICLKIKNILMSDRL